MRPLGIPLCSWGIRQKLTRQLEQGVLRLVSLELNASVFELGAELPGLRTQPRGAVLRARAEEAAPLVGPLEQLEEGSTSLHLCSAVSWANRSRTSSSVLS